MAIIGLFVASVSGYDTDPGLIRVYKVADDGIFTYVGEQSFTISDGEATYGMSYGSWAIHPDNPDVAWRPGGSMSVSANLSTGTVTVVRPGTFRSNGSDASHSGAIFAGGRIFSVSTYYGASGTHLLEVTAAGVTHVAELTGGSPYSSTYFALDGNDLWGENGGSFTKTNLTTGVVTAPGSAPGIVFENAYTILGGVESVTDAPGYGSSNYGWTSTADSFYAYSTVTDMLAGTNRSPARSMAAITTISDPYSWLQYYSIGRPVGAAVTPPFWSDFVQATEIL